VEVHDSGPGIPASKHSVIFEPFVRLENRTDEGVSGAGIGLSISRDLARLHGGDLILESSSSGAKFVFRLKQVL
jgi:signal transduction histidine kinase